MIRHVAQSFRGEVVTSAANRLDPERSDMPAESVAQMSELNLFGIRSATESGGLGAIEYCLVAEEHSRGG